MADEAAIARGAAANTAVWVKPLWVTLGLGALGLGLFVGSFFFAELAGSIGLGSPGWLPWTRGLCMIGGAFLIIIAAPAEITRDRLPENPNDPPKPLGPRPLKRER